MKSKKLLLFAFTIAIALLSSEALPLAAQNSITLSGTYSYSGEMSCLSSSTGFNPNLTPIVVNHLQPTVWISSVHTQGTVTFNLNGTGTVRAHELTTNLFPTNVSRSSASSDDVSFTFDYQVAVTGNVRTLTLQVQSLLGTILTGPNATSTFTIANLPPLSGPIARNGTMVLAGTVPTVETITLTNPAGITSSSQRICQRMRTLARLY